MRVAIVGAGVLGRIYGLRLAEVGCRVSFLVRPARASDASPFVIEPVTDPSGGFRLEAPHRVTALPEDTEVAIVAVRFDQLARDVGSARASEADRESIVHALREVPRAMVMTLTPLLVEQRRDLEDAIGRRVVTAMPGVTGYLDDRGVVRYWSPIVASTFIDDDKTSKLPTRSQPSEHFSREFLAQRLTKARLPTRLERNVDIMHAATTISFFPIIAALDAGRGIDSALADKALLETVLDAAKECEALSRGISRMAPWATMLTKFIGPFTLKAGVGLARRMYPDVVRFVEAHFGGTLHSQHLLMGHAILQLARDRGHPTPALARLVERLAH